MRNIVRKLLTFLAIVTISASCVGIEWIDEGNVKFAEYVLNEEQSKNAFKYVVENGYSLSKTSADVTPYKVPENAVKLYVYNYDISGNDTYSVVFVDNEALYGIRPSNIDELVKKDVKKNKKKIDPSTAVDIATAPSSMATYFVFGSTAGTLFDICTTLVGIGLDSSAAKQSKPSWKYGPGIDFVEGLVEAAK